MPENSLAARSAASGKAEFLGIAQTLNPRQWRENSKSLNCKPSFRVLRHRHVLRLEDLEAVASRMGALGAQLAQGGAPAAAAGPMRVALAAALAVLARCQSASGDEQVWRFQGLRVGQGLLCPPDGRLLPQSSRCGLGD